MVTIDGTARVIDDMMPTKELLLEEGGLSHYTVDELNKIWPNPKQKPGPDGLNIQSFGINGGLLLASLFWSFPAGMPEFVSNLAGFVVILCMLVFLAATVIILGSTWISHVLTDKEGAHTGLFMLLTILGKPNTLALDLTGGAFQIVTILVLAAGGHYFTALFYVLFLAVFHYVVVKYHRPALQACVGAMRLGMDPLAGWRIWKP